eukprot:jgi/Botrbrau1/657/Bobra.0161s0045.1
MEFGARAPGRFAGQFEAWAANLEAPDELGVQAPSSKTLCSVLLSREGTPHKLYEVAAVHFGDIDALTQNQFVKLVCKTAVRSPGDAPHTVVVVHTSLVSAGREYSEAVLKNPDAVAQFDPERVLLTPPSIFDKLDRVFVTKIEPPAVWVGYSAQIARQSLGSPPAKITKKVKTKEKIEGTSKRSRSRSSSASSSQSEEVKKKPRTEAEKVAQVNKGSARDKIKALEERVAPATKNENREKWRELARRAAELRQDCSKAYRKTERGATDLYKKALALAADELKQGKNLVNGEYADLSIEAWFSDMKKLEAKEKAGEIIGLLDYLFAEHWELHCAQLRKLASEAGKEQFASQLLAVNVQRTASVQSYVPNYRPPAGRGRGFPAGGRARKELFKGGYDLTHYPNAKPEPTHCCRGWWLDGECNATAGIEGCKFQHAAAHRGQGMASTSAQPRL